MGNLRFVKGSKYVFYVNPDGSYYKMGTIKDFDRQMQKAKVFKRDRYFWQEVDRIRKRR